MKKLILTLVAATTLVACDNGLDDGFNRLSAALDALLVDLEAQKSELETTVADLTDEMEALQAAADELDTSVEAALEQMSVIRVSIQEVTAQIEDVATEEEVAALMERIQTLSETVQALAELGDSDYDGVINLLDKCPGTEPDVEVDTTGCPIVD